MSKLWCVKGNLNDGEIFLRADAVEISPHGELAFYRGDRFALPGPGPRVWRLDVLFRRSARWPGRGAARRRLRSQP
jgi:hypothetical protein